MQVIRCYYNESIKYVSLPLNFVTLLRKKNINFEPIKYQLWPTHPNHPSFSPQSEYHKSKDLKW